MRDNAGMYALFEEAGKFLAGRVLSEAQASAQVELESGKRSKVKDANIVLRFDKPTPSQLMDEASAAAKTLDLNFLWEVAPQDDFGFEALSDDYHGAGASVADKVALLFALHGAPHYFQRRGKGRFRKAPQEQVQAALAGLERKRQEALRIEAMAGELTAKTLPQSVGTQLYKLLFKPDKSSAEYKALVLACQRTQRGPLDLLRDCGAIRDAYEFHMQRFFFEWFPKGTQFPDLALPPNDKPLPEAAVEAFSIDDSATTEIDDAFSVQFGEAHITVGIHIAAPGVAINKGDAIDTVARSRMSTVYMPGNKYTMLPDHIVNAYTLAEGRHCPALSLYLTLDASTLQITASRSALERVKIAANLRHDKLDAVVTEAALAADWQTQTYAYAHELQLLHRLAQQLKLGREQVRGKPERYTRPDYNFAVSDGRVSITPRMRGAPLDLIVSELMIVANSTWGKWLADCKLPGIYRSQQGFGAMMRTRMGTEPRPHIGLGVQQYTWSTSPLRRYTDLVNQWQLLACVQHGAAAALAAPFKPKDAELYAVVSAFESAYRGYAEFQATMERYWTLHYLEQEGIREADAEVLRDGAVRFAELPLITPLAGAEAHPRGTRVRLQVMGVDYITLELRCRLLHVLQQEASADEEEDEEAAPVVTTVHTAVDVAESVAGGTEGSASPA